MEATAVLIADAGSNTQMQPSQLQLYLLKRVIQQQKVVLRAARCNSQARFGHEVVNNAGHLLLVLQVSENGPRRRGGCAYIPNAHSTVSSTANDLSSCYSEALSCFNIQNTFRVWCLGFRVY